MLQSPVLFIDQLAFGHDGSRVYAAGARRVTNQKPESRGVAVWSIPGSAAPFSHLLPDQFVTGFCVNPAGPWLYLAAKEKRDDERKHYRAVELSTGASHSLGLAAEYDFQLAVLPDGGSFVASGYATRRGPKVVARWKQPPGSAPARQWLKTLKPEAVNEPHTFLAVDRKGTRIVTLNLQGEDHDYLLGTYDPRDWSLMSRSPVSDKIGIWDQLLFHPNDRWLVLRSRNAFYVWDANDLDIEPKRIAPGKQELTAIAFHPSGRYLAATSNDTTVKLYDTATWEVAKTFAWKVGRLRSVAFSPDGMLAAVGSDTGKIVVWDVDL